MDIGVEIPIAFLEVLFIQKLQIEKSSMLQKRKYLVLSNISSTDNDEIVARDKPVKFLKPKRFTNSSNGFQFLDTYCFRTNK
jgi:hypothetical protein